MIRKLGNILFILAIAAGGGFAFAFFTSSTPNQQFFSYSVWAFIAAFVFSLAEAGNKTALQKIFLSLGALALISTLHFSLGAIGWIGFGVCAFLVLTMKIDGGD